MAEISKIKLPSGVTYTVKDDTARRLIPQPAADIVKVSDTAPTSEYTQIWIKPTTDECQVPTWEEFQALVSRVAALENRT